MSVFPSPDVRFRLTTSTDAMHAATSSSRSWIGRMLVFVSNARLMLDSPTRPYSSNVRAVVRSYLSKTFCAAWDNLALMSGRVDAGRRSTAGAVRAGDRKGNDSLQSDTPGPPAAADPASRSARREAPAGRARQRQESLYHRPGFSLSKSLGRVMGHFGNRGSGTRPRILEILSRVVDPRLA